jgi:hypothetical protein
MVELRELVDKLNIAFPIGNNDSIYSNEQWVNDLAEQTYGYKFLLLPQHQQEFIKSYVEWNCKNPDAIEECDDFYNWMLNNGHPVDDFIE